MSSRFIKLAEFNISESKGVVISAVNSDKISVGQKITFYNNLAPQEVFLKNAIVLDSDGIDTMVAALLKAKESLAKIRDVTQ